MATKRVSLKDRRAQDKRGVDALFGDEDKAESAPAAEKRTAGKPDVVKVTLYIRPDQVLAIEDIQLRERRRTGKRVDKSALIQEALDLLIQQYGNTA